MEVCTYVHCKAMLVINIVNAHFDNTVSNFIVVAKWFKMYPETQTCNSN